MAVLANGKEKGTLISFLSHVRNKCLFQVSLYTGASMC